MYVCISVGMFSSLLRVSRVTRSSGNSLIYILYHIILYHILYNIILYHNISCHISHHYVIFYCVVLSCIVMYSALPLMVLNLGPYASFVTFLSHTCFDTNIDCSTTIFSLVQS